MKLTTQCELNLHTCYMRVSIFKMSSTSYMWYVFHFTLKYIIISLMYAEEIIKNISYVWIFQWVCSQKRFRVSVWWYLNSGECIQAHIHVLEQVLTIAEHATTYLNKFRIYLRMFETLTKPDLAGTGLKHPNIVRPLFEDVWTILTLVGLVQTCLKTS